jgi:hypothetical protein
MCWALFNTSCKTSEAQTNGYSAYYFPVDDFPKEGMVYTYRNLTDKSSPPEVWRHLKLGNGLIESINYGMEEEVVMRQFDRIVSNGVVTDSILLFWRDTAKAEHQIKVNVISPYRFPFEPGDSTKLWLSHIDWHQPGDSLHVVLKRGRRYAGNTQWTMDGKSIPAVRFITEDTFETEKDGWTTSAWTGEEIYAKGIGLVYYRRKFSPQLSIEFELESRK